jgi:hypothetical protein
MLRISALCVVFLLMPGAAQADPITAGITAFSSWFATAGAWTQFAVRLGASLLLNALANALAPRPRTPDQKRELQAPRSRPPKRFVYGRNRVYGSPAPWRVRGNILYGCLLLNSRPSAGGVVRLFMDKREAQGSAGDIFDFSGLGYNLDDIEDFPDFQDNTPGNPRVWVGRGDQTAPPQAILDEVGPGGSRLDGRDPFFQPTDGWQGCTVMWVRLDVGGSSERGDRWRAAPPEIEIEMDWSLVWDPRDPAQDPDDPATWTFSRNQALILLDALRQNPLRRYPFAQIHLPSFEEAADVADEPVLQYFASLDAEEDVFAPRYEANGVIVWTGAELVDQVRPIADAGGGDIVRIGGRIGYAAGEHRDALFTVTDIVESGGIQHAWLRPGRELPVAVKGVFISPERDWQEADLTPVAVAGAEDLNAGDDATLELRLPFVTSATQAMRLQQIMARRLERQRSLSITLWPEAMNAVAGANITLDLTAGFERLNGLWRVVSANPTLWVSEMQEDEDSQEIALRIPVTLEAMSAEVYAWVPETDEQELLNVAFTPVRPVLAAPQNLSVASGDGISTSSQARLRVDFDPVEGADFYEVFLRADSEAFTEVATTEATEDIFINVAVGVVYDVRVLAVQQMFGSSNLRRVSPPAEVLSVQGMPADYDLGVPSDGQAEGGAGQITVSFVAPNSVNFTGLEFWGADTDDLGAASLLGDPFFGSANAVFTLTETGLGVITRR